jgi:hypothetical protein
VNPVRGLAWGMRLASLVSVAALIATVEVLSQERFSFFQASTPESVGRMLTLAELRDDDVVVDLGSGDGLIPLTAARMNPRLKGWGVDIDPKLVEESNERARREGVADRVRFEHRNAFDADLRDATVVTMWLFTRVLTSTWDLGTWRPDKVTIDEPAIYLWIVPARVAGGWDWELTVGGSQIPYGAVFEQHFQTVEGVARAGGRREVLDPATLRGGDIAFTLNITLDALGLTRHEFTGTVDGDQIVGTAKVTPPQQDTMNLPWRARRTARSRYFMPTGTALFQRPPELR